MFRGGGVLPAGESGVASTFSNDVPDVGNLGESYEFTIRGQPIVPEPTALIIRSMLGGGLGLIAARRRKAT